MRTSKPGKKAGSKLDRNKPEGSKAEGNKADSNKAGRNKLEGSKADPELVLRARKIAQSLVAAYPDARCMLDHEDAFQLLVATILAAQCTDERVNKVTPSLFKRFPTPGAMAKAGTEELEELIRSTGFFHNKAKSIKGASAALTADFPKGFPQRMEDLVKLPGVGRKTANVVLGTCFGQPAIVVDTHFRRVTQRLGLTQNDDPDLIEEDIAVLLPSKDWTAFSHAVTFHGRKCCAARKPDHAACPVRDLCPSRDL
jgi:endonuclease III